MIIPKYTLISELSWLGTLMIEWTTSSLVRDEYDMIFIGAAVYNMNIRCFTGGSGSRS